MKKTILPLALLVLVVMVASACANTTSKGTTTPKSTSSTSNAVSWKPSLFPMELGNHWIYHYSFGDGKREELRVKHVVETERGLRLDDADGECYYFVSDAQGWRINGETKLDDEHHTHYFKPAMVYASQELFSKGKLSGDHQVEDEGVIGENTIKSEATFEGIEEVELPRLGKLKAIHTTFAYLPGPGSRFQIHNWLVDGLGPVKRTLRMTRGETEIFSVTVTLMAARIGGKVFPQGDEGYFAKTIFDEARKHRRTVDKDFAGLTASVIAEDTKGGKVVGQVTITKRGEITLESDKNTSPELASLVESTLAARYGHRARMTSEPTPPDTKFELLQRGNKASVAVRNLSDSSMGSNYEVYGSRLWAVSRDMGPRGYQHLETEEVLWQRKKYLPTRYWWEMRDGDGEIAKPESRTLAEDSYTLVGGYLLPTTMKLTSGGVVSTIRLLEPKVNAAN